MFEHHPGRYPAFALCLVVVLVLAGCSTGGGSRRTRGKLSEATAASAGEEEERGRDQGRTRTKGDQFTVGEEYQDDDFSTTGVAVGLATAGGTGTDSGDDDGGSTKLERGNLNLWFSHCEIAGDVIRSLNTGTLMYSGFASERGRVHLGLYYGRGKLGSQPNIQEGLRWIAEAGADIGGRYYLTADHAFMGFYLLVGGRIGVLSWSYTNALEVPDEEVNIESISNDGLWLFTPYLGLGTSLVQTKAVHFGVSVTTGIRLARQETFENFENDLIKNVGEYKLNLEASIFF
jgi:hypothetical protein